MSMPNDEQTGLGVRNLGAQAARSSIIIWPDGEFMMAMTDSRYNNKTIWREYVGIEPTADRRPATGFEVRGRHQTSTYPRMFAIIDRGRPPCQKGAWGDTHRATNSGLRHPER